MGRVYRRWFPAPSEVLRIEEQRQRQKVTAARPPIRNSLLNQNPPIEVDFWKIAKAALWLCGIAAAIMLLAIIYYGAREAL